MNWRNYGSCFEGEDKAGKILGEFTIRCVCVCVRLCVCVCVYVYLGRLVSKKASKGGRKEVSVCGSPHSKFDVRGYSSSFTTRPV